MEYNQAEWITVYLKIRLFYQQTEGSSGIAIELQTCTANSLTGHGPIMYSGLVGG